MGARRSFVVIVFGEDPVMSISTESSAIRVRIQALKTRAAELRGYL